MNRGRWHLYWFLSPTLVVMILLVFLPTVVTIIGAFSSWTLTDLGHLSFAGWGNFKAIFNDPTSKKAILNTVLLMVFTVPIQTVLGVGLALLLRESTRWNKICRTLLLIPTMSTPVAMALVWSLMLDPNLGILDVLIRALGGKTVLWTSSPKMALPTLALIDIWQWTPFIAVIVNAGLQSVSSDLIEAARFEGAKSWTLTWHIFLPLVRSTILAAVTLRLIDSLQLFDTVFVVTGGGPGNASNTLNFLGYQQMFNQYNIGYASATACILLVIITIFVLLSRTAQRVSEVEV